MMNVDRLREALLACGRMREQQGGFRGFKPEPWMALLEALAELTLQGAQQDAVRDFQRAAGGPDVKPVVGVSVGAETADAAARAMLGLPTFPEHQTEVYKPGVLRTEFNGDVSERIIPVQPVDEAGLAMYTLICHIHASIRHCEEGECAPYALVQVRDWAQLHKWALAFETRWKAAGKVLPASIPAEPV